MTSEFIVAFLTGVFVGSFGYRVWRNGRSIKTGQRPPPRQSPPAPVPRGVNLNPPPMADTIYGCDEHYYGGCPNCGRGRRRWPGQPDPNPRGGSV